MTILTWKAISTFTLPAQEVLAPWFLVCDLLGDATYLRLKTSGLWTPPVAGATECGPDGVMGEPFPDDRLVVADCPVGALIGRIGGSSAVLKGVAPAADAGEGRPFPVGCDAIVKLPDKAVGPLFLGFNILLRPVKVTSLTAEIYGGS